MANHPASEPKGPVRPDRRAAFKECDAGAADSRMKGGQVAEKRLVTALPSTREGVSWVTSRPDGIR